MEEMAAWCSNCRASRNGAEADALGWAYGPLVRPRRMRGSCCEARNSIWGKRKKSSHSHAQGHPTAQLLCRGACVCHGDDAPTPPSYSSVEAGPAPRSRCEGAACLSGPSSQPVWASSSWLQSFSSTGITFSSESLQPPWGLPAIFLLLTAAVMVSPEVAHTDKILIRVRNEGDQFLHLGLSFYWFL